MMSDFAKIINAGELAAKGVTTSLKQMRPVLGTNQDMSMVGNATLREDEWRHFDERVNDVLRSRLTVADDLRSRGLVEPISLGAVIRSTDRLTNWEDAQISYDGDTAPQSEKTNYEQDNIPVPVIAKDFSVNWRQLIASRERGDPLDTTGAQQAAARVQLKIQDLITNGVASGGPTGGGIPGLTSASGRITGSLAANWDDSGGDPIGDVENMMAAAFADYLFGPFVLYIPTNYWAFIQRDYSSSKGDRTYMERLLAFNEIEAVRPNDALSDDNVVMVQMTRDVIDLSEAQPVMTVQWEKNPWVTLFRVLWVGGPQIKSLTNEDGDTIKGIVHYT